MAEVEGATRYGVDKVAQSELSNSSVRHVAMEDIKLHPDIYWAISRYRKLVESGAIGANQIRINDFRRLSFVYDMLPDEVTLLDIGIGAGQFVNAAAHSRRFAEVLGMDYREVNDLQRISQHWRFVERSLTAPVRRELKSEYVTCMECIEHIASPDFEQAVKNLRALATEVLIVTIPFEEREPIPHFHKQRFDLARLRGLFPEGEITLLTLKGKPLWACVYCEIV